MTSNATAPRIPVTLFFDYTCPFCYIASHRLEHLNERHQLDILWRFVETHPAIPAQGMSLSEPGHGPGRRQTVTENLQASIADEKLPWGDPNFTTNTRQAILLAQMTLIMKPQAFLPLHRTLFHTYFGECRNIGNADVLGELAQSLHLEQVADMAWGTNQAMKVALSHVEAARQLRLASVPTLVVANRPFAGAVSMEILEQALQAESSR